jgi:DNA-binding NarL/FixJ family response regulator
MNFTIIGHDAERREGLKTLVRHIDRHARYHEAKDWRQARSATKRFEPDLILIDWHQSMRAQDLCGILRDFPGVPAAAMVDEAITALVRSLFEAGAHGVVPRTLDPQLIVRAIEMVLVGGHFVPAGALDPRLAAALEPRRASSAPKLPRSARCYATLSPRQQQIMRCVHMGNTNKMIAKALGISEGTVKIHLASIFQQLGAANRAAAVAIYNGWQHGYLEVLRRENESSLRPAVGESGPVPLRAPTMKYLATNDGNVTPANDSLPIAAEPVVGFGQQDAPLRNASRCTRFTRSE